MEGQKSGLKWTRQDLTECKSTGTRKRRQRDKPSNVLSAAAKGTQQERPRPAPQASGSRAASHGALPAHPFDKQDKKVRRGRDEFSGATYHVLVEKIENHVGEPCVTPVPVHKEELAEMLELSKGEVAGHHSLQRQRGEDATWAMRHVNTGTAAWPAAGSDPSNLLLNRRADRPKIKQSQTNKNSWAQSHSWLCNMVPWNKTSLWLPLVMKFQQIYLPRKQLP